MDYTFLAPEEQTSKPVKLTRTGHRKTRTGCITCKIRHIKCDERKPNCFRCTSTGRKCDGYIIIETVASIDIKPTSSSTKVPWLAPGPTTPQFGNCYTETASVQRSLDFFFNRTAPQLSGFFEGEFWNRFVPLLSTFEPAICHALIAVGALHEKSERFEKSPFAALDDSTGSELIAYDIAVSSTITLLQRDPSSMRVPLTACILFVCMEFLRGDMDAAMRHIESGIKIIKGARDKKYLSPFTPMAQSLWDDDSTDAELGPIFGSLACLATLFGRPSLGLYSTSLNVTGASISTRFSSFSEAKLHFFDLFNMCLQFNESVGEAKYNFDVRMSHIVEKLRLDNQLEEWKAAFEAFADINECNWSSLDVQAANVLRAGFLATKVRLSGSLESEEVAYDKHKCEYEEIVRLSEKVLLTVAAARSIPTGFFSFGLGIISPLHFVASRCRWPLIRRKALSLLYLHPRRESLYDSKRSYNVMKRVMLVEELSLGVPPGQDPAWDQLPPESVRIHQIDITIEPVTPIGTPVNFISKPDGIIGAWHIRREFIHLGSLKIFGSMPMLLGESQESDLTVVGQSLSQPSGTSGSLCGSISMPLSLKSPNTKELNMESWQYHRRKRLFVSGGPIVEGEPHEISGLGAILSDPTTGNW